MGWIRAILTAAAIAVVGIAALVYGPNAVLTKVHGMERGTLVAIAAAMFFALLIGAAWALRWMQRRHVI